MRLGFFRGVLLLGDLGVFYTAIYLSLFLRHFSFPDWEYLNLHLIYFSPLIALWLLVFYVAGLYSRQTILFKKKTFNILFLAQSLNILIFATVFFFFFQLPIEPKLLLLIYFFVSSALLLIWRLLLFPKLWLKEHFKLLSIGLADDEKLFLDILESESIFPIENRHLELRDFLNSPLRFKKDVLNSTIVFDKKDELPILKTLLFMGLLKKVNLLSLKDLYSFMGVLPQSRWDSLGEIMQRHKSLRFKFYFFIKNVFDLLIAILLLPFAVPALLLVYLLVRFFDGKPVFYLSKRKGVLGKDFYIYKFRTMNGSDTGREAIKSKLKVTKLGRFLRASRLDELPQIFNILKGQMSFIGPRPEISELADEYEKEIPEYIFRYLLKPGLSGWAQINHHNDPHHAKNIEKTKEKLEYDLFYIKEASLLLDLNIFIQTILVVMGLKGK